MLFMKPDCEICHAALPHQAEAYICSYECSFCSKCAQDMGLICKNCQGDLQKRPKRQAADAT